MFGSSKVFFYIIDDDWFWHRHNQIDNDGMRNRERKTESENFWGTEIPILMGFETAHFDYIIILCS